MGNKAQALQTLQTRQGLMGRQPEMLSILERSRNV